MSWTFNPFTGKLDKIDKKSAIWGSITGTLSDQTDLQAALDVKISSYVRAVTKVVAANDSIDKTNVDYVCDGVDDQVQIQAAIDAVTATGGTVLLLEGTYNVIDDPGTRDYAFSMISNVRLVGMGRGTILFFRSGGVDGTTRLLEASSKTDFEIADIRFTSTVGEAGTRYAIRINACSRAVIRDCYIDNFSGDSPVLITGTSDKILFEKNYVTVCDRMVKVLNSDEISISSNYIYGALNCNAEAIYVENTNNSKIIKNVIKDITFGANVMGSGIQLNLGSNNIIADNILLDINGEDAITVNGVTDSKIINNTIRDCCKHTDNLYYGIQLRSSGETHSLNNIVSGNNISSGEANKPKYGIYEADSNQDYNIIINNNITDSSTVDILYQGTHSQVYNNVTESPYHEQKLIVKKNTDGDAMAVGDLVVLKSVAGGDEVIHTTTGGDDKVFGVVAESITNNAYGLIQVLGKTVSLKVNGTDDICIGDFISTYTTEGIGKKASQGEKAIAIALEAYTTDDSNGVIDALIISPVTVDLQTALDAKLSISGGTLIGAVEATDHGTAATDQIINVCYGTGDPPAANTVTEGAVYIKYTA